MKSLRQQNCRAYQNLCAYQKLGGKVLRLLTIWARQNLQLLTSSKSGWRALVQVLVDSVASGSCRPQVIWRHKPLCFYGQRLSRTLPACCTGTTRQNLCGCQILCARLGFHQVSYHCTENSYMITIAVQIQLPCSQAPKWRPSSILAEVARIWL